MKKISMIIPVYNAEKTIRRCLDSILASAYENYEVILIDDGSTDNSGSIISEYKRNDKRFKVISQSNLGPSTARNKGLDIADGDIISFIDSDDYVRYDYLEQLSSAFHREIADVVFFGFHRVNADGIELSVHEPPNTQTEYYSKLIGLSEADMFGYTWIKAFRRDILRNVRFDEEMNLFEDEIFTCKLLEQQVKIFIMKEPIYYYVRTEGTLARRTHNNYCQLCDKVFREWSNLLSDAPNSSAFLNNKANHMAKVCQYYGIEREIKPLPFYKEMSSCAFMNYVTLQNPLIISIKEKKWLKVQWLYWKYIVKVAVSEVVKRGK